MVHDGEVPVLEHHNKTGRCLTTGEPLWADYTVEAIVRQLNAFTQPNNDDPHAIVGLSGLMVRYQDLRRYYIFGIEGYERFVLYRREDEAWTELAGAGRVEANCLPFHLSALPSEGAWLHHLDTMRELRGSGLPLSTALVSGPNGVTSGIIDHLVGSGVRHLLITPDIARGSSRLKRPAGFWWESKAGERLLVWLGAPLDEGRELGIGGDFEQAQASITAHFTALEEAGYPFEFGVLQLTGAPPGPNSAPDASLSDFVRDWNRHANPPVPASSKYKE